MSQDFSVGFGLANRDRMYGHALNTKSIPSYTTFDAVVSYGMSARAFGLVMLPTPDGLSRRTAPEVCQRTSFSLCCA
jgi:hypothetical protein